MNSFLKKMNDNPDKVSHFFVGYFFATILPFPLFFGLVLSLLVGIAKEAYDYCHPENHTCDKWDMFATWGGGLVGYLALLIK